ncbi:helix-turn-helix domain-containing protein [Paenibacillus sp. J5C_2022]|uniref:helix-turn-helix domain-containing protein n=1 Tax=Paenibacillus sp. J5C2022 TaxID=2977129 RepID=UPI0021CFB5A2|nr:helix-turn-helix domain-containing protein [Paenibacillus sp. J5C2022]MCU6711855.1 helix-turn-helix domain-containing protein [Paenibacillus sp. J5C2022]
MPPFAYRSYKKVVVVYIVFFLTIIATIAALSYWNSIRQLEQSLKVSNLSLLEQMSHKLEQSLKDVSQSTLELAELPAVKNFVEDQYESEEQRYSEFDALSNAMKSMTFANPNIYSVYLYSLSERKMMTDNTIYKEEAFFDMGWLDEFREREEYSVLLPARRVEFSENNDQSRNFKDMITLVRTYPILSVPGTRTGAVVANIDENLLYESMTDNRQLQSGTLYVLNAEGKVVIHGDKKLLNQKLQDPYVADIVSGPDEGAMKQNVNGSNSFVFYLRSEQTGWTIVRTIPVDSLNGPFVTLRNILAAIAVVMGIVSLVVIPMLGRWTLRPVDSFMQTFRSRLKLQPPASGRRPDFSLGNLEQAFHQVLDDHQQLQEQLRDSKQAVRWRYLMEIVMSHRYDYEQEKSYFKMLDINLYPRNFIVMTIEMEPSDLSVNPKDKLLYLYGIGNMAEELINAECKGVSIQLSPDSCTCILSFEADDERDNAITAYAVAELIKDQVPQYVNQTVTIGVGKPYSRLDGVHRSYLESLEALSYRMIMGSGTVISYEDVREAEGDEALLFATGAEKVMDAVKKGDMEQLRETLHAAFRSNILRNCSPDMLKQSCLHILMKAAEAAAAAGIEAKSIFRPGDQPIQQLMLCKDAVELEGCLLRLLMALSEQLADKKTARTKNDLIEVIRQYVDNHFQESELSLNLLADEFRISVPYLSKLFKEHAGSNFVNYLFQLRMGKAESLLRESRLSIQEIAEAVGYNNAYSFIRIFKKHKGVTPGEYRNQVIEKDKNGA